MRRKLMWIDGWAVATTLLVLGGFVFMLLLTWTLTAHGQGAAATQPASQPAIVVPAGAWPWFTANASWLVPVVIWILSTVCTALTNYPKAGGVVRVLRLIMGGLSVIEFKNGKKPGLAFKLPVAPPAPPPDGGAK